MTDPEAKRVLAILFAAYPVETRNVTREEAEATARAYRRGLDDLDENVAMHAIDRLIKTAERLPTIAALRKAALEIQHGRKRPGGEAWGDVLKAMRSYGHIREPGIHFQFEDPLVARAVAAFGWQDLCGSENAIADRARFIELYESLEGNARADAQISNGARLLKSGSQYPRLSDNCPTHIGNVLKT